MINLSIETVFYPFTAFNFAVEITIPEISSQICNASFSECDGLEITMEPKTIREGGNNGQQIRLSGPMSYGQLTLKRGMTANFDLWRWFDLVLTNPATRADAEVIIFAANGFTEHARFLLRRCLPVKLRAPSLNAQDGKVAIEELQLAYETLKLQ